MNEITQIHLGRTAFTVSVEAHKELREYLDAIAGQVGKNSADVLEEVELRMAELLSDRGISGDKVVLPADIAYLKEQLGEPHDFKDDTETATAHHESEDEPKRLFRDTEHGMIAGVAAGLATYFGIDSVIIRILFVALTLAGGSGILIYLLLWLLVPEARTASDRLSMAGKAATVDNLKQLVERADVPGVAQRASHGLSRVFMVAVKIVFVLMGIGIAAAGIGLLVAAIMALVYGLAHGAYVAGTKLFPVGLEQHVVLICGVVLLGIFASVLMILGASLVRRRRVVSGWFTLALVSLFIVAASLGGGLSFDAGSKIRSQYLALEHTRVIQLKDFTSVSFNGNDYMATDFMYGQYPEIHIRTLGRIDTSAIKVTQDGEKLTIDTSRYHPAVHCNFICPYGDTNTAITVVTPNYGLLPDVGHFPAGAPPVQVAP